MWGPGESTCSNQLSSSRNAFRRSDLCISKSGAWDKRLPNPPATVQPPRARDQEIGMIEDGALESCAR